MTALENISVKKTKGYLSDFVSKNVAGIETNLNKYALRKSSNSDNYQMQFYQLWRWLILTGSFPKHELSNNIRNFRKWNEKKIIFMIQ